MRRSRLRRLSVVASGAVLASGVLTAVVAAPALATPKCSASICIDPSIGFNNVSSLGATITSASGGMWTVLPGGTSPTVTLTKTTAPTDTITGDVTNSPGSTGTLHVNFDLRAAEPGVKYDVVVTPAASNPNPSSTDTCAACFSVVAAGNPTITSVSPSSLSDGTTNAAVTVQGTNFARGLTLTASPPAGGTGTVTFALPPTSGTSVSSTSIVAKATVSADATPGPWTVTVKNVTGPAFSCGTCFSVISAPRVDSTVPNPLAAGKGAAFDVTFNGAGFQQGATVAASADPPTVNGVTFDGVSVNPAGTQVIAKVHVPAMEPNATTAPLFTSARTVTITNPSGTKATTPLTVDDPPTVTSISGPGGSTAIAQGGPARHFTITGTNFKNTSQGVVLGASLSGSGMTVDNVQFVNSTTITADFAASMSAATGTHDVTVTNGTDGGVSTGSGLLTVDAAPTITSISPDSVGGGDSGTMTINGSHFVTGAVVTVNNAKVHFGTTTVAGNGNSLTVPYTVDASPPTGTFTVTVTNPDQGFATCDCLAVQGLGTLDISPAAVSNNTGSNTTFTITGTGFDPSNGGPTVTLTPHTPVSGQGPITLDFVSMNLGHTSMDVSGDLNLAAPVVYDLTVTNNGASNHDSGVEFNAVTVANPVPTLTSMSGHAIVPGQVETLTLHGTNFSNGLIVHVTNGSPDLADVHASAVQVTSSTTALVTFTADSDATAQTNAGNVSAQTADGQSTAVIKQDLNVKADPALALDWPSDLEAGAAGFTAFPVGAMIDNSVPNHGGTFKGRVDLTISGISGLHASDVDLQYDSTGSGGWVDVPLSGSGSITGYIPPQAGQPLADGEVQTTPLRVKLAGSAPTGQMHVASTYGDVASNSRIDTVASDSDNITVAKRPSAPQNVQAAPGNASALVTWDPSLDYGGFTAAEVTYTVHVLDNSDNELSTVDAGTANNKLVTGLTNGTAYKFTVTATNPIGDSAAGGPAGPVTPHVPTTSVSFPPSLTAGGAPADLSVSVNDDTVTAYPQSRIDVEISGLPGITANRVSLVDTTGGASSPVALSNSAGKVVGSLPNSGTFNLPSMSNPTLTFTIQLDRAAPGGSLTFKATLVDASGSPDVTLSSDQKSATVLSTTGRLVTFKTPREIVNSHIGLGLSKGRHGGANTVTIPSSVPGGAKAVVLDVHVDGPTKSGSVRVYPTGGTSANRAVSYQANRPQDQVTITPMGSHQVTLRLSSGVAYIKVDLLGYETVSGSNGGRLVPVAPKRVGDTRGAAPGAHRVATVTLPSTVPANATAVLVEVTALDTTSAGRMTVYKAGTSEPGATAVDFVTGKPHTSAYITQMSSTRKIIVNIHGHADALVDLLGYYSPSTSWSGRFQALAPTTIAGVKSSGKSTITLPSSVPANATSVFFTVTAAGPSALGSLRTFATGTTEPAALTLEWGKGASVSNLVASRIGAGNKVTFDVRGGSPALTVELIGYGTG